MESLNALTVSRAFPSDRLFTSGVIMGSGLPYCLDISTKLRGEPIIPSHACVYLSNMTTQGGGITITIGRHILNCGRTEMSS